MFPSAPSVWELLSGWCTIWLPSMYILELNLSLKRRPDGLKRSSISRFGSSGEEREEQETDMILLVALEPKLEPFWWKTILLLEASSTDWQTTVRHYHFRTIKPTKCYAKVSRKVGYKVQKAQREYAKYREKLNRKYARKKTLHHNVPKALLRLTACKLTYKSKAELTVQILIFCFSKMPSYFYKLPLFAEDNQN